MTKMTMEQAVIFFLDSLSGRYRATMKEVNYYFRNEEKYIKDNYALTLDIMATFKALTEKEIIKHLSYSEMDNNQKNISDKEMEEIYVVVTPNTLSDAQL